MKIILITSLLTWLSASIATAEPTEAQRKAMTKEAQQITQKLVNELGSELKKAMAESGPDGAISVCRNVAPMLASTLSRQTGWKVGRVSLRTRNPLIGQPDAWEQQVLQQFDDDAAGGKDPRRMVVSEIVSEPAGSYFRFMKALPVKPVCLTCHGTDRLVPDSVRERLQSEYPHDQATGYYAGQVRGAVSIKRRLSDSD